MLSKHISSPRLWFFVPRSHLWFRSRSYFTNTGSMKRDDPYAQLGLQWGDGATLQEIKQAYKRKCLELHPDVHANNGNPTTNNRERFQALQQAYQTLVRVHSNLHGVSHEKDSEWRTAVWRNSDRLAVNRTDVAGVRKKRPAPAASLRSSAGLIGSLGTTTTSRRPAEYIGDGSSNQQDQQGRRRQQPPSSSVGRGRNKWVTPKEFVPWNGKTSVGAQRASDFRPTTKKS